ncbi:MAG: hypothetical protein IKQ94_09685 [Bacteroidales bacterium]|nr:hypothetical protein [Bacteroidales bacterium]
MNKKNYLKATVEVIEFRAEKGFAASGSTEAYEDGGGISWDGTSGSSSSDDDGGFGGWDF